MGGTVYIRTNPHHTTLYVGVTSDGERRDAQHRNGTGSKFTTKYNCTKLVWYRQFADIRDAIAEEKRIKGGSRAKKVRLVDEMNPTWRDLGEDWNR